MYKIDRETLSHIREANRKQAFEVAVEHVFSECYGAEAAPVESDIRDLADNMLSLHGYEYGIIRNREAAQISADFIRSGLDSIGCELGCAASGSDPELTAKIDEGVIKALDEYGGIMHDNVFCMA